MTADLSADPNIVELRRLSSPSEYGTMLRLATEMDLINESSVDGFSDLWSYLKTKNFESVFIENIARAYWRKACSIVTGIPYRTAVTLPTCGSERRLMSHLLRQVCSLMAQET
jgi:hypothetical protein